MSGGANAGPNRRSLARRLAMQGLYQWLLNGTGTTALITQFRTQEEGLGRADPAMFEALLTGAMAEAATLTALLAPHLDRPVNQLDPVEHAVLLLGAYELAHAPDVPWKVCVNEAVNLAKLFGAEDGFRFINGVLDRLARDLRPREVGVRRAV